MLDIDGPEVRYTKQQCKPLIGKQLNKVVDSNVEILGVSMIDYTAFNILLVVQVAHETSRMAGTLQILLARFWEQFYSDTEIHASFLYTHVRALLIVCI